MSYKYFIKGGRFQREFDYHRERYYNKDGLESAKQQAFNCIYVIMVDYLNTRGDDIFRQLRDGTTSVPRHWKFRFKFLQEYGLPNVGNIYRGVESQMSSKEWLEQTAILLDKLLIDNDRREVEVTSKAHNEYRIKSDSDERRVVDTRRMF